MPELRTVHDHEVVVEFDPTQTFSCLTECTWCCGRGVELQSGEAERLHALGETDALHERETREYVGREQKSRERFVDVDGAACVFLDDDGLCGCERAHSWKPTGCSLFPLAIRGRDEKGRLRVGLDERAEHNCPGLGTGERVVDHLEAFLPERLWVGD